MRKVLTLIEEGRLPWVVTHNMERGANAFHYLKNRCLHASGERDNDISISFKCGFHGKTGGVHAIASIANMLSKKYRVFFETSPASNFNSLLDDSVRLVARMPSDSNLYILDVSCEHEEFRRIKANGGTLLVSCHGFLDGSHGLSPEYVMQSLELSDLTHFVNEIQQESFQLEPRRYFVIPNSTKRIMKTNRTSNAGVVGNLNDGKKNVTESIEIFLKSKAEKIHLWSCSPRDGHGGRVLCHSWENNKERIYNSFDVLVFMGKLETFSLTVVEAMSAGIPCLISAIPAHEQYRDCPGVVLVDDSNRGLAHELLDALLENRDALCDRMISHYESNYSERAVSKRWYELISGICNGAGSFAA